MGYMSKEDMMKTLSDAGVPAGNISGHLRQYGFAHGGSVSPNKIETPEQLRAIILAIQSGR